VFDLIQIHKENLSHALHLLSFCVVL